MKKIKCRFVVIGAGVSGLTAAYKLSQDHPGNVVVIEKERKVGGLSKTINVNNSFYDLGSHRIHYKVRKKAFRLIQELCNKKLMKNKRGGRLRIGNSYINYPISSVQFIVGIGFIQTFLCALSLLKSRIYHSFFNTKIKKEELNYESYLIRNAGRRAYKLFYEPYARKVWGCDPSTISITAVKKRISMVKPTRFLKDILAKSLKKTERNDYYYYLKDGIGYFADILEKNLLDNKAGVYKNVDDFRLILNDNNRKIIYSNQHEEIEIEFEKLISTIPLEELVLKLNPPEDIVKIADRIKWRDLKLAYLHIKGNVLMKGETFYFPELKYIFGRVSIPKRFSSIMQPDDAYTSFVCEVPCGESDRLWNMADKNIYDLCFKDLINAGLLDNKAAHIPGKNFIINTSKVYPLYIKGWQKNVSLLLEYLGENFDFIYTSGKQGFFLHCNFDHSINIGLSLEDYIKRGKPPKEWYSNINLFQGMKLRD